MNATVTHPVTGYEASVKKGDKIRPLGWRTEAADIEVETVKGGIIFGRCVARGLMKTIHGSDSKKWFLVT